MARCRRLPARASWPRALRTRDGTSCFRFHLAKDVGEHRVGGELSTRTDIAAGPAVVAVDVLVRALVATARERGRTSARAACALLASRARDSARTAIGRIGLRVHAGRTALRIRARAESRGWSRHWPRPQSRPRRRPTSEASAGALPKMARAAEALEVVSLAVREAATGIARRGRRPRSATRGSIPRSDRVRSARPRR